MIKVFFFFIFIYLSFIFFEELVLESKEFPSSWRLMRRKEEMIISGTSFIFLFRGINFLGVREV